MRNSFDVTVSRSSEGTGPETVATGVWAPGFTPQLREDLDSELIAALFGKIDPPDAGGIWNLREDGADYRISLTPRDRWA